MVKRTKDDYSHLTVAELRKHVKEYKHIHCKPYSKLSREGLIDLVKEIEDHEGKRHVTPSMNAEEIHAHLLKKKQERKPRDTVARDAARFHVAKLTQDKKTQEKILAKHPSFAHERPVADSDMVSAILKKKKESATASREKKEKSVKVVKEKKERKSTASQEAHRLMFGNWMKAGGKKSGHSFAEFKAMTPAKVAKVKKAKGEKVAEAVAVIEKQKHKSKGSKASEREAVLASLSEKQRKSYESSKRLFPDGAVVKSFETKYPALKN